MLSAFAIRSLFKKTLPYDRNYTFYWRNMPPQTRKLITFANCLNPLSSFVNVIVSVYTGIIPCFIPPKDNHELKPTFVQYGVNTPRLDRWRNNVRQCVLCLDASYVLDVLLKNEATYSGSLGRK